jgi:hypothetical protein
MAEWQDGGMAEWQDGGMAEWRKGGMVFYYIPNLSCYIYGTCRQRLQCRQHRQHQRLLNRLDVLKNNLSIESSEANVWLVWILTTKHKYLKRVEKMSEEAFQFLTVFLC